MPMTLTDQTTQPSTKEPTSTQKYREESFSQLIEEYCKFQSREEKQVENEHEPLPQLPSTINLQINWEGKTNEDRVLVKNQRIEYDAMGNVLLANLLHNI